MKKGDKVTIIYFNERGQPEEVEGLFWDRDHDFVSIEVNLDKVEYAHNSVAELMIPVTRVITIKGQEQGQEEE